MAALVCAALVLPLGLAVLGEAFFPHYFTYEFEASLRVRQLSCFCTFLLGLIYGSVLVVCALNLTVIKEEFKPSHLIFMPLNMIMLKMHSFEGTVVMCGYFPPY